MGRRAIYLMLIRGLNVGLLFGTLYVASQSMGTEDFGLYRYVFAWTFVIGLLSQFGRPETLMRELSSYMGRASHPDPAQVTAWANRSTAVLSVLLGLLMFVVALLAGASPVVYLLASLTVVVQVRVAILNSILVANSRQVHAAVLELLGRPGLVLALLIMGHLLLVSSLSAEAGIAAELFASVLVYLVARLVIRREIEPPQTSSGQHTGEDSRREWRSASNAFAVIRVSNGFISRTAVLALGLLVGPTAVAFYTPAAGLAALVSFGLLAVNILLLPDLAVSRRDGFDAGLRNGVVRAARLSASFGLLAGAGILLTGNFALGLLGEEYTTAYPVLVILTGGLVLNSFSFPADSILSMAGAERLNAKGMIAWSVSNVILVFLVARPYGAIGVAWATTLTLIVWNLSMIAVVYFRFGIDPTVLGRHRSPQMSETEVQAP